MPRDGDKIRQLLQRTALELFHDVGYEQTTAAQIAEKAGVTERTFFRHFADKREVLFDGDAAFSAALTNGVRNAPPGLGPWDILLVAFKSVEPLFIENRQFSEPRQRVIACNPALQERALAKTNSMIVVLTAALCERGVPNHHAKLAAQMGAAALSHAVEAWFNDGTSDLGDQIVKAFNEVRDISAARSEPLND